MKKLSVLIIAAAMLATSLIGLSASADASSPYPGTVKTKCHVAYKHARNHKKVVRARGWVTSSSNLRVRGKLIYRVKTHGKIVRAKTFNYGGGAKARRLGKLKKGHYRIKLVFRPKHGSVFKGCSKKNHVIKVK